MDAKSATRCRLSRPVLFTEETFLIISEGMIFEGNYFIHGIMIFVNLVIRIKPRNKEFN
jgi:hypothetical protein